MLRANTRPIFREQHEQVVHDPFYQEVHEANAPVHSVKIRQQESLSCPRKQFNS